MNVFAKIIQGKLHCKKVFENDRILAIQDAHPVAPVHILIMPKKPIRCLQDVSSQDLPLIAEIIQIGQQLAAEFNIASGYRFLTNNGAQAGQTIGHLHFHLIGGRELSTVG